MEKTMDNIKSSRKTLQRMAGNNPLRKNRGGGDGSTFPLRVAKVTRVDSKSLSLDLMTLTGNTDTYEDVPMTFANAGSRHFVGAIPQVNDLCVIGYSSAESGFSRTPYIVSWLVPGHSVGYDWLVTQLTDPKDLEYNPKTELELQGLYGKRRHKLRQMEPGDVVMSSSTGSDVILDEDVTISNRRGNELILRDSDQSLIVRSLQQFHAGSGFRVYSGMVQRDANLLPTWLFDDGTDYANPKQLDDEGDPLEVSELPSTSNAGQVKLHDVFESDSLVMGINPKNTLQRGLFIDESGQIIDTDTVSGAVYGGKQFYRVSQDLTNSVTDIGANTFTEYRIEVSHTADGTLPVTEQTEGIDIDRLPQSSVGDSNTKDLNPQNKSINAPMVEMVMGTVIGNDKYGDPDSYGIPLVAQIHNDQGNPAPSLIPAGPNTPVTSHLAWLVKVNNPISDTPPAFMGITKGGSLKSYFPGKGSDTFEEYYESGRITSINTDTNGVSQRFNVHGSFSVYHHGTGAKTDNSGIHLQSDNGYVNIIGNGYSKSKDGRVGINLQTEHTLEINSHNTRINNNSTRVTASNLYVEVSTNTELSLSDTTINTETYTVNHNGNVEYNIAGSNTVQYSNPPSFAGLKYTQTVSSNFGGYSWSTDTGFFGFQTNKGGFNLASGLIVPSTNLTEVDLPTSIGITIDSSINNAFQSLLSVDATKGVSISTNAKGIDITSKSGELDLKGATVSITAGVGVGTRLKLNTKVLSVHGVSPISGSVITDSCKDNLTGRSFKLSGTRGITRFQVK